MTRCRQEHKALKEKVEKLTRDASSLHQNWKQERAALSEVPKTTRDLSMQRIRAQVKRI